ncbi:MAG: IS110 family transposase [Polyangiaceae bacterium]
MVRNPRKSAAAYTQVCVRNSAGEIVDEQRLLTRTLPAYLECRPPGRVIVETCGQSFLVAEAARAAGHQVRIVSATLVRALGVGARRTKNDRRDAQALSEASCRMDLPSVHIPSAESRSRKTACGMRDALVSARTQLINTVRGWMRGQGIRVASGNADTFHLRVRKAVPDPPSYVARQLDALDALTKGIDDADEEMERLAKADPVCTRLMTLPGVGPVTSLRFVSTLDRIERFPSAHHVQAYLGLTPGERSSGDRQQRTGITKAGSPPMRWTLVQSAWCIRRVRRQDPMVVWSQEVEKRRGKRVATTALARKIAGVLFAMWRDGTVYNPARGAAHAKELVTDAA